ncbi:MAG: hypothetical protein PHF64_00115 [Methanoregula sp.]|nr:hypothetical protein [Methanoregula sp.]
MSGAIGKLIAELHGCAGGAFGNVSPDTVSAARAELAAKDATIERLRETCSAILEGESGAEDMASWCKEDAVLLDLPAEEIIQQLCEDVGRMRELAKSVLTSLPPSDMRMVPLERLKTTMAAMQAAWCLLDIAEPNDPATELLSDALDSLYAEFPEVAAAIRDAEREKA